MASCVICGKDVTTHLYVAIVNQEELLKGGTVKATHVGVRLPEHHLANYRSQGISRDYLPALAGDTTALEAWQRRLMSPRPDGTVRGRLGVIEAERVEAVREDVARAIDLRHDRALIEAHCRGHELDEVVKVLESYPLPVQLRWNPGEFVRPLLRTPSPDKRKQPYRSTLVRSKSDIRDSLRALLEVN